MRKQYIHYGNNHFSMEKFKETIDRGMDNRVLNKPNFGLWGSPIDSLYSWKDWCEAEDFHTDRLSSHFIFEVNDSERILTVSREDDIKEYLKEEPFGTYSMTCIDFEKIMRDYDAMELCHGNNYWELHSFPGYFYSWDVDSIVVWNPYAVVEICDERKIAS